jgi:hypothetical protein
MPADVYRLFLGPALKSCAWEEQEEWSGMLWEVRWRTAPKAKALL